MAGKGQGPKHARGWLAWPCTPEAQPPRPRVPHGPSTGSTHELSPPPVVQVLSLLKQQADETKEGDRGQRASGEQAGS